MLDKIYLVNDNECVIYCTHRASFRVFSDKGVLVLVDELLSPLGNEDFSTLTEYVRAVNGANEDTLVVDFGDLKDGLEGSSTEENTG